MNFCNNFFQKYFDTWKRKSAELYIKGKHVYLAICFEKETPEVKTTNNIIGLDRGINNTAVLSNNQFYSGNLIKKTTNKIRKLRSSLQSKNTKSAKRHLKKLSNKENSSRRTINHQISRKIINSLPTGSILVLEDLSIKTKKKLGKKFNKKLGSWAWFQLEQFLTYKAQEST